eukprot:TRINITY_DN16458_c0_g1_i1.p1 TRINITY_DN16458_c0_g1~~TRINITY_DN16458_c0_g1_i1.p1  ORF type:complete len:1318 (+),score=378.72 TRINITY_DN16458_c0_g1_i1:84-3956(+)
MLGNPAVPVGSRPVTVTPRVFPGPVALDASELRLQAPRGALGALECADWGAGRLFAYAQGRYVAVSDAGSCQHVTALDGHRYAVTALRLLHPQRPAEIQLASGDAGGYVLLWDVPAGRIAHRMRCHDADPPRDAQGRQSGHAVLALRHQPPGGQQGSGSSLVALCSIHLVLFDATTGNRRWRKVLSQPEEPLFGLSLNSHGDVLLATELPGLRIIADACAPEPPSRASGFSVADLGELQHAVWCPAQRSLCFLVMRQEVLLFDVRLRKVVDSIRLGAARAEFRGLFVTASVEDCLEKVLLGVSGPLPLYTLHADGSVAAWLRRTSDSVGESVQQSFCVPPVLGSTQPPAPCGMSAQQQDLRLGRSGYGGRPCLMAMERMPGANAALGSETLLGRLASVCHDGSVAVWEHHSSGDAPWCLRGVCPSTPDRILQLRLTPLFVNSSETAEPQLCCAVTTANGLLQVYDTLTGALALQAEICSDRGAAASVLRPVSDRALLVGATKAAPKDTFTNVLVLVALPAGRVEVLRDGREADPQQLQGAEVSPSGQLLAAVFSGGVAEIWDVTGRWLVQKLAISHTFLRWMPAQFNSAPGSVGQAASDGETAMWIAQDGLVSFFKVRGGKLRDYSKENPKFVQARSKIMVGFGQPITAGDWFDDLLISGDSAGMMCIVNLRTAKYSHIVDRSEKGAAAKPTALVQIAVCPRKYADALLARQPQPSPRGPPAGGATPREQQRKAVVCLAIALFVDGHFSIYDVGKSQRISSSEPRDLRALAVAWARGPLPVVATPNGTVLILDLSLTGCAGNVYLRALSRPLRSLALLPQPHAAFLAACFCNGLSSTELAAPPQESSPREVSQLVELAQAPRPHRNAFGELVGKHVRTHAHEVQLHTQLVEPEALRRIEQLCQAGVSATARRCFLTAALFADQGRMLFWSTAQRALSAAGRQGKQRQRFLHPSVGISRQMKMDMLMALSSPGTARGGAATDVGGLGVDTGFGERESDGESSSSDDPFRLGAEEELQMEDAVLHAASCAATVAQERATRAGRIARFYPPLAAAHVRLGQLPRAVQLLLDTPADSPEWRTSLYKACVISASESPLNFQQTVKRVAAMLMSRDDVDGAVELLFLIGKGPEAVAQLQGNGRYEEAAVAAKCALSEEDAAGALARCAEHRTGAAAAPLAAAGTLLAAGDFVGAIRTLEAAEAEFCDVAALLGFAAQTCGALDPTEPESAAVLGRAYATYRDMLLSIQAPQLAARFASLADACGSPSAPPSASGSPPRVPKLQVSPQPSPTSRGVV